MKTLYTPGNVRLNHALTNNVNNLNPLPRHHSKRQRRRPTKIPTAVNYYSNYTQEDFAEELEADKFNRELEASYLNNNVIYEDEYQSPYEETYYQPMQQQQYYQPQYYQPPPQYPPPYGSMETANLIQQLSVAKLNNDISTLLSKNNIAKAKEEPKKEEESWGTYIRRQLGLKTEEDRTWFGTATEFGVSSIVKSIPGSSFFGDKLTNFIVESIPGTKVEKK